MWEGRRYLSEKMRASPLAFTFKSAEAGDSGRRTGVRRGLWPGRSETLLSAYSGGKGRTHQVVARTARLSTARLSPPCRSERASTPRPRCECLCLACRGCSGLAGAGKKSCPILLRLGEQLGKSPRTPGAWSDSY